MLRVESGRFFKQEARPLGRGHRRRAQTSGERHGRVESALEVVEGKNTFASEFRFEWLVDEVRGVGGAVKERREVDAVAERPRQRQVRAPVAEVFLLRSAPEVRDQ